MNKIDYLKIIEKYDIKEKNKKIKDINSENFLDSLKNLKFEKLKKKLEDEDIERELINQDLEEFTLEKKIKNMKDIMLINKELLYFINIFLNVKNQKELEIFEKKYENETEKHNLNVNVKHLYKYIVNINELLKQYKLKINSKTLNYIFSIILMYSVDVFMSPIFTLLITYPELKALLFDKNVQLFFYHLSNYSQELYFLYFLDIKKREKRKKIIEKFKKDKTTEKQRAQEKIKKQKEMEKNKKYKFCINNEDYITLDNINDIEEKNLVHIIVDKIIHCFDKESLKSLLSQSLSKKGYVDNDPVIYWTIPLNFSINILEKSKNIILDGLKKGENKFKIKKTNKLVNDKELYNINIVKNMKGGNKKFKLKIKELKVKELKKICSKNNIKGCSKLNKKDLINKILKSKKM